MDSCIRTEFEVMGVCVYSRTKERGDGSVLALGIYNIQLVQWILQLTPQSINATGTLNVNGVDSDMQAEITYANDVIARISASSVAKLSNTAVIRGTKGEITVNICFLSIRSKIAHFA